MNEEEQVASLRQEIRWVAAQIHIQRLRSLRICLYAAVALLITTLVAMFGGLFAQVDESLRTHSSGRSIPLDTFLDIGFTVSVWGSLAAAGLCLMAAATRRSRATQSFAGRLNVLPSDERRRILCTLDGDRLGDTRRITRELSRRFGIARELTPAGSLDARGDEGTPAEQAP